MTQLWTMGHGRLDREGLSAQLRSVGIESLVDVRRFPGSRTNPDVSRDALPAWLPGAGVGYRWEERLGGRRRLPDGPSPDPWWKVESFRAYAAHTRTEEFEAALAALLADAASTPTVVLCSESVWWRCHRRLVADVAVLRHGVDVRHLLPEARTSPHQPAPGARLRDDGRVVWDRDVP
ncbi:DUF488 domain-containing protein [Sanguibacter suaedae]|uniref:DUF488 domain-containing protein n=1 Tax=Sanguibacter suaedae TaxID=2795737 RepID=UPI0027DC63AA|nr:DUF488 domain-containing protein [Sanguibacter suaedae]